MRVCWMFVVLLGCSSSLLTRSESPCDCNGQGETLYFMVNASSSVTVPCRNMTKYEVITFNLFQDEVVIYNFNHNHNHSKDEQSPSNTHPQTLSWKNVTLVKNAQGEFLGFKLTGVTASSQGIYRCQGISRFPPPLIKNCSQRVVVILSPSQVDQGYKLLWIWIVVVVLLTAYSLIITVFAVHSTVKLRRTECNNDYMNTKPRAPRGHKKNRGIQTPIPRHF
ncbi:T-cell-specific surface glycoprotein CD28 [Parambassis ranga]|uniref:T-cell-specific surface glycoprotein CD28 n=1 Tax=Parambassis ranga TaxID=210632 RepID=A0A6P7HLD1_9TELE|nr:T-cell-specific surface glycoprotein CD28-like [Parambassis ranga]